VAIKLTTIESELNCFVMYCIWGNKIMFKLRNKEMRAPFRECFDRRTSL